MGQINRKQAVFWLIIALTVFWMLVIFMFSAANSTESSELSSSLLEKLAAFFRPDWDSLSRKERRQFLNSVHGLFRKMGHFTEYTVLGILLSTVVRMLPDGIRSRLIFPKAEWWLPALLSFLYAVSDELHQKFVPGRSCELRDTLIDLSGACLGILICTLAVKLSTRRKNKKASKQKEAAPVG